MDTRDRPPDMKYSGYCTMKKKQTKIVSNIIHRNMVFMQLPTMYKQTQNTNSYSILDTIYKMKKTLKIIFFYH